MSMYIRPGRIVPQDHVEWLITRYGYRRIVFAVLAHLMRRRRIGLKPPAPLTPPPQSAHLRRDIGLPPDQPTPRYWDIR